MKRKKPIDIIFPNSISKHWYGFKYDLKIKKKFKKRHGYELNIDNPTTFCEKIFYRKKYGNFEEMALYADKFSVRKFIEEKIGNQYLIPLLGCYEKLTIEDLQKLPNKFVVKTTHGSGKKHIEIVHDKRTHDLDMLVKKMNKALHLDFGYANREYWYTKIPRRIIIEKFLESETHTPEDYKFHCFGSEKLFIAIDEGRFIEHKRSVYNSDWQLTNIKLNSFPAANKKEKPENFELMKSIVKKLSKGFDYIRVDLYSINGKVYFGEFTHAPANGMEILQPSNIDYEWGEFWEIDKLNQKLYTSFPN